MIIKQLSVFLENRVGRTREVTRLLAGAGIDILAFSTADMIEFGVLRIVVEDVEKAQNVLKDAGFATMVTDGNFSITRAINAEWSGSRW